MSCYGQAKSKSSIFWSMTSTKDEKYNYIWGRGILAIKKKNLTNPLKPKF